MNAQVTIEKITPRIAGELLAANYEEQRHLQENHVSRLAATMTRGAWHLSPDAITIVRGKLFNGQHRLQALIAANRTYEFLVLRSNDDQLYQIIDSGKTRTVGDVIACDNANLVAAISKWALMYKKSFITRMAEKAVNWKTVPVLITRDEHIDFINDNSKDIATIIKQINPLYKKKRIISPVMPCVIWLLAPIRFKEKALSFITTLYTGEGKSNEAVILYNRLLSEKISGASKRTPRSYMFGLLIKGFNSFVLNQNLKVFKILADEKFPIIIS
jgi:hypothetical protein